MLTMAERSAIVTTWSCEPSVALYACYRSRSRSRLASAASLLRSRRRPAPGAWRPQRLPLFRTMLHDPKKGPEFSRSSRGIYHACASYSPPEPLRAHSGSHWQHVAGGACYTQKYRHLHKALLHLPDVLVPVAGARHTHRTPTAAGCSHQCSCEAIERIALAPGARGNSRKSRFG